MAPTVSAIAPPAVAVAVSPSLPPTTRNQSVDFEIRSYLPRDHKAVCELFAEGMLYYRPTEQEDPFLYHGFTEYVAQCCDEDLSTVEATYMGSGGHFWVVPVANLETGEEELAAMIALEGKGNGVGELRRLSVNAKYQRHGLGAKLVAHVEQWATRRGFRAIQLNTDIAMTPALKLYDRLGYTRTHHETIREDPPYYLVWFRKMLV